MLASDILHTIVSVHVWCYTYRKHTCIKWAKPLLGKTHEPAPAYKPPPYDRLNPSKQCVEREGAFTVVTCSSMMMMMMTARKDDCLHLYSFVTKLCCTFVYLP